MRSCVSGAGIKIAWWLLFYLGKVWLLMLALKASTVEACGIRGGRLFHVKIVLGKKLYLNALILVWYGWKPRGWVRESLSFAWRYGWDVIATTPFIILYSKSVLKWFFFLLQFSNLENLAYLRRCWCYDICRDSIWLLCVGQIQVSILPLSIWIPHTSAVLKGWPSKCLVCLCVFMGVCLVRTFLFTKPRVLLALAPMLQMWVFHFRSLVIVIPRVTIGERSFVTVNTSHFLSLNAISQVFSQWCVWQSEGFKMVR